MIRLVDPDPRLARFLSERGPKVLPAEVHEWVVEWVYDVGEIVRSRSFMAYTIASVIVNTVLGGM